MERRVFAHFDWPLLLVVLVLDIIGLTNLYSAVYNPGIEGPSSLFYSQAIFMGAGLTLMLLVTLVDYRVLERVAYPLYGLGLMLLAAVLVFGKVISGSQRWLDLGFFSLQPSEPTKIFYTMALARFFRDDVRVGGYGLRELVKPLLLASPALILIFISPDLGTTGFYVFIFGLMAISMHLRWRTLALILAVAVVAAPLAYEFVLTDYQRDRVITLLDPHHDPRGKGYQTIQARYAIGGGRLLGNGYLQGMQTHQGFIPENHTDFIITVMAEEWGFVGCAVLLLLYMTLLVLGLRIAAQSKERFGAVLAVGLTSIFFLQVAINLSAVLGVIPVTGVTLPFISYGGSSILTLHVAIGLLLNISMRRYMF
ncbi:MAG: rod shape-determining protein RodA [Myxococcota bacterium]